MTFVCLGDTDESKWEARTEADRVAIKERCVEFDDEIRRGGHLGGGETLQGIRSAVTLRHRNGQVAVTDGPYAETKEQFGGILILDARDLNHAIQLMSKHPGIGDIAIEIRPADEQFDGPAAPGRP